MPAHDLYHDAVKNALIKDGWTITHDPFRMELGRRDMYVDLGAERLLAAEKANQRIAVEIKSFVGPSDIADLEQALGQYILYHDVLEEIEPDRILYLAVPQAKLDTLFAEPVGDLLVRKGRARLIGFRPDTEEITRWIP